MTQKNIRSSKNTINLHEPHFFGNENKYLKECIRSTFVSTNGKYVEKLENNISKFLKNQHCVCTASGTSALDLSLKVLGANEKCEIIVPTLTFIAPINTVIYNNAHPIFIDCDKFLNIDVKKVINFIKENTYFKNKKTYNKFTKKIILAVIVVHIFGNAVLLDELKKICKKRNIFIIEDASESFGTRYTKGRYKGEFTGTIGDIGCFSFNGNKIITAGSGGAIVTNNSKYAKKSYYLSTQAKDNKIKFIHNEVGYNYRMSNLNAAVALGQLENFKKILELKNQVRKIYKKIFNNIEGLTLFEGPEYSSNNNWLNLLRIDRLSVSSSQKLIEFLVLNNINARPIWHLNHLQKPFKNFQKIKIENATKIIHKFICLPSSAFLKEKDIKNIGKKIKEWIQ